MKKKKIILGLEILWCLYLLSSVPMHFSKGDYANLVTAIILAFLPFGVSFLNIRFKNIDFKIIGGIWTFFWLIMGFAMLFSDQILFAIVFLFIAVVGLIPFFISCSRKINKPERQTINNEINNLNQHLEALQDITINPNEYVSFSAHTEVSEHVYKSMKGAYSSEQAERDIEILTDCYTLCATSNNMNTVICRVELGLQKTHTLLQAEQAGILETSLIKNKIEYFKNGKEWILIQALYRSYDHALEGMNKLKTDSGKENRINTFMTEIEQLLTAKIISEDGEILCEELMEEWKR